PWRAARVIGSRLSREPRRGGQPHQCGEHGRRAARVRGRSGVMLAAEPPRAFRDYREVAISSAIASAADRGSAAPVMGRPTARYVLPAAIAPAGVAVLR